MKKYFIQTFGCQQNVADSERIATSFEVQGYAPVDSWKKADVVVINTCMVRQMAEDRVYGLVKNIVERRGIREIREIGEVRGSKKHPQIIVTGCMVGLAAADKTGKIMARLRERMPGVEFIQISEFKTRKPENPKTQSKNSDNAETRKSARDTERIGLVPISNGCNNFCTYCVVPFARGREASRPWEEIIDECKKLKEQGYKSVMLLGQNVNSYGADLVRTEQLTEKIKKGKEGISAIRIGERREIGGMEIKPVMVKHLGRYRIPTLFPYLLDAVAKMGFGNVNFMSSNPWDFSDELIEVIAKNKNITRTIHLPVQSGDDSILKKMNRWYTAKEYIDLSEKLKAKIDPRSMFPSRLRHTASTREERNFGAGKLKITTDIIVGFPGETEEQFQHTVDLCQKVKFDKAYISLYSPRPMTAASKNWPDDVPHAVKKKRWEVLEKMINKR